MKLKDIPGIGKPAPGFSERRGKNNSFFQTLKDIPGIGTPASDFYQREKKEVGPIRQAMKDNLHDLEVRVGEEIKKGHQSLVTPVERKPKTPKVKKEEKPGWFKKILKRVGNAAVDNIKKKKSVSTQKITPYGSDIIDAEFRDLP